MEEGYPRIDEERVAECELTRITYCRLTDIGTSDLAEELFTPIRAISLAVFCLSIRPGLFDIDDHLKDLSAKGNDLERRNAIVDFEMFRQQDRDARWTVKFTKAKPAENGKH